MSDPWFAALASLGAHLQQPLSSDPDLVRRIAPDDPGGWSLAGDADVDVTDDVAPGPHGDVPVRVYRPRDGHVDGGFVWCHGGAWVMGDLAMPEADGVAREVAARGAQVVVSVDYRLAARGVHHPVPLDDVVAAFRWAAGQAAGSPVALGGASAGANLAAGAALRLRDEGGPMPSRLVLAYPLVHPELPPLTEELAAKVATLSAAARFAPVVLEPLVQNYLGGPAAEADGYAMPARADLAGLPPTLVHNDDYDALRSSGESFAEALRASGVDVELSCAPDVAHGHLNRPWMPQFSASIDEIVGFLRR